jgi:hypothetical protein
LRFIRDRADARFLPSRFHFALFRLGAWLKLMVTPPQPRTGLAMAIDRDQSALEHYTAAYAFFLVTIVYLASALSRFMSTLVAALVAIMIAAVLVEIPMFLVGRIWTASSATHKLKNNVGLVSNATFLPLLIASIYFASTTGWQRCVAWIVLILCAANVIAAVILRVFRDRVIKAEQRFAS